MKQDDWWEHEPVGGKSKESYPYTQREEIHCDLFGESGQEEHDKGTEAQGSASGNGNLDVESSSVRKKKLHHLTSPQFGRIVFCLGD